MKGEKETSVLSLLDSAGERNQLVDLFTKNHIAPPQLQMSITITRICIEDLVRLT